METKEQILNEIIKLTERVETLKSALAVINEFENSQGKAEKNPTIKTFKSAPLVNDDSKKSFGSFPKKTQMNDSTFVYDILKESKKPMSTSEIRKIYAEKVGMPEDEIQQFVDSTLYKSTKHDKGIVKVHSPNSKHTLYTLKRA